MGEWGVSLLPLLPLYSTNCALYCPLVEVHLIKATGIRLSGQFVHLILDNSISHMIIMIAVIQINTKGISCHCFGSFTWVSRNPFRCLCVCLDSLPDPGSDRHAGGAGDFLWAAAPEAAEEDVLREEGEAAGPPCHFGAWPSVLYYGIQESCGPQWGQNPSVCQCHYSGLSQWWPHDRLNVTHTHTLKNDNVKAWGNVSTTLEQADHKS